MPVLLLLVVGWAIALSDYWKHWGLIDSPFRLTERCPLFLSVAHRRFLVSFNRLIAQKQAILRLSAQRYVGLTTILRFLSSSNGFDGHAVQMALSPADASTKEALLESLQQSFQLSGKISFEDSLGDVSQRIALNESLGIQTIWILDRPSSGSVHLATQLAAQFSSLKLMIAGMGKGLGGERGDPQKSGDNISLGVLSYSETSEYIRGRLREVGGSEDLFSRSALVSLHDYSGGKIGVVSQLAEEAMRRAIELQYRQVTWSVVESMLQSTNERVA
ncbi:MAG: hypothetical protein ACPHL6_04450 [Rubripirellula sp.]